MRKFLTAGLLALACSTSVFADRVFSNDSVAVRLSDSKACSDKKVLAVTKMVEEGTGLGKQEWKQATVVFEGRTLKACYTTLQDQVLIVDEEGDGGAVPKAAFKQAKEV